MKKYYLLSKPLKKICTLQIFLFAIALSAQSESFECDFNAYLFQYNDIYAIDLASGSSFLVKENIVPGKINGAAYNSADGYLWGYTDSAPKSIIRIGKDFNTETYTIPEIPVTGMNYVGDISLYGQYYFRAGSSTYYHVDLNPESPTYLQYMGSTVLSRNIKIHDWAFNAADNMLYAVEKATNRLYRIEVETGEVEDLGEVPILAGNNYTYGAVYFDLDGNFYVSANQTGSVYVIREVQNITAGNINSNIFAFGPASASNDGARCPTAPVPQEDCKNGIDDDGDGLVDCDDPSCSGVASCPVTFTASTGNNGGLESNDRLANLISNRNYKRVKNNYEFDKTAALKVFKTEAYMKSGKHSPNNIPLNTLIPLDVIGESNTIESAPSDLLELTNASDIYAVDYLRDNETVSAMMVIKTNEKVYEHSKFICDRFLGAQLLSVSTIQLREKDFIKSIIKQPDGSLEFAISFSARLNEESKFIIESHWNIDSYEKEEAYYNFQIWSNSIDDLLSLAEEVLNLLESNTKIKDYKTSMPPPVFVKSAKYEKGQVLMNIVNNNKSENLTLEGGIKRTETSSTEIVGLTSTIDGYLDTVSLETGNMFDFGFRISNGNGDTPDDLFVADAPWGLDDSAENTNVMHYEVKVNQDTYWGDGYPIERNINLSASTSSYVGVYRALSPRFAAVDLSSYSTMSFTASGTGNLEVKLLKSNGDTYSSVVSLSDTERTFYLKNETFTTTAGGLTDFSDLKVLTFNLKSSSGAIEQKTLNLKNVEFSNAEQPRIFLDDDTTKSILSPNPVTEATFLYFFEDQSGSFELELFDLSGKRILSHSQKGTTERGQNRILINRDNLGSGLYLYRLESSNEKIWSGRLLVK
ncbi:DUF6923 family protein [Croceitalea marina]|uniref:DUF6923 family protein n=1 Tax=Croceitalea marina TaxID=1775166 RepID=A0ABW5MZ47_9FLAO